MVESLAASVFLAAFVAALVFLAAVAVAVTFKSSD